MIITYTIYTYMIMCIYIYRTIYICIVLTNYVIL